MRVTNSMLVSNFMNNLNINMTKMDKLQNQMASGKKFAHISDDPISYIYSREARYKLNRLEHYQMSVQSAQDWLRQVEGGVSELNEVVKSAYEACTDAATDVKNEEDKKNVSEYIKQLRDHLLTTLNATFGDKYLYGGYNTTGNSQSGAIKGPFTVDENTGNLLFNDFDLTKYSDPAQQPPSAADKAMYDQLKGDVLSFEVGPGLNMQATVNGIDLVMFKTKDTSGNDVEMNLYDLLNNLYKTVNSGAPSSEISEQIKMLQDGQNHLLSKTAEIGGRTNRLDLLAARYEQDEINYSQMLSDAEDADFAEVIMNQKMAEAVYNAALAAGSKIIQTSLMDFLR